MWAVRPCAIPQGKRKNTSLWSSATLLTQSSCIHAACNASIHFHTLPYTSIGTEEEHKPVVLSYIAKVRGHAPQEVSSERVRAEEADVQAGEEMTYFIRLWILMVCQAKSLLCPCWDTALPVTY